MAFLDNQTISVNAILTKKGRELLASQGSLNISSFALADDEIDYSLYDPNHPNGSSYFDLAIRNTPIQEPFSDETQALKFKLVTLPSGVTAIPVITLDRTSILIGVGNYKGQVTITPSTNPSYNTTLGYTAILSNKNAGTIVGQDLPNAANVTIPSFIGATDSTTAQVAVGLTFLFIPNTSITTPITTRLTIIGNESGGNVSIPVTVYRDSLPSSLLNS